MAASTTDNNAPGDDNRGATVHHQQQGSNNNNNDSINMVIPVNASPTEVLAERFASWRKIIRALNVYFKEVASVNDEVVRQNIRLGHAVAFPFFDNGTSDGNNDNDRHSEENSQIKSMFLDISQESIADVPGSIISYHRAQAAAGSRTSKELSMNVIPRLEDLRRDLVVKIKEIKSLASDFKNNVAKEQSQTAKDLENYNNSVDLLTKNSNPHSNSSLPAKHDPYLLKITLNSQLVKQIKEENYLLEAYQNLQSSGRELENVVVQEIQQALTVYGKLLGVQAKNLQDISNKIMSGYVSKDSAFEWDAFVKRDKNFVDPSLKPRKLSDIQYTNQESILSSQIREGYLERRSKYLKSYSRAWYVLTPSFLHEFKSSDRNKDPTPVMSISLNDCQITEDQRKTSSHKFILQTKHSNNSSHHHSTKGHNWVFRAESAEKLKEWFNDLSKLTSMTTPIQRARSYHGPPLVTVQGASTTNIHQNRNNNDNPTSPITISSSGTTTSTILSTAGGVDDEQQQQRNSAVLASPVPSDTSAVTSNGEPFEEREYNDTPQQQQNTLKEEDQRKLPQQTPMMVAGETSNNDPNGNPNRGRFPSEVRLDSNPVDPIKATDSETLHREANTFIVPADYNTSETAVADDSSVFSYDLEHPTHSTYYDDKDFKPVNSDVPVEVERRLTQTSHKIEDSTSGGIGVARSSTQDNDEDIEAAVRERRASVKSSNSDKKSPSRKPTKSYGTDELKPLTSNEDREGNNSNGNLFFSNGLPETTGGKKTAN